jgi:cation/acetate symporter
VGVVAIGIGIAAKGQNVAHLVALAFAVAASANLPVILLTLYWKRCNTGGVVAGLLIGTLTAIGLVLVSPNMTYPGQVRTTQERAIKLADERIAKLNAELPGLTDAAAQARAKQAIAAAEKAKAGAESAIQALGGATTSIVGLSEPLFPLRNPGLISIPLGFLAVVIGSLLYRDRRAEEMWEELYVRSNTGIGRAAAAAH